MLYIFPKNILFAKKNDNFYVTFLSKKCLSGLCDIFLPIFFFGFMLYFLPNKYHFYVILLAISLSYLYYTSCKKIIIFMLYFLP